jgi:hypothetical protein
MIELGTARAAVKFAKSEATPWAAVDLDERRRLVTLCLDGLREHKEMIALLLMWEIGKPHAQALTDIDRGISGVEWYVDEIEGMLDRRTPLGLRWNKMRSRGDRDEAFGGIGQSWKGCLVGGKYLVQAVTQGLFDEKLCGNFPAYTQPPELAEA